MEVKVFFIGVVIVVIVASIIVTLWNMGTLLSNKEFALGKYDANLKSLDISAMSITLITAAVFTVRWLRSDD